LVGCEGHPARAYVSLPPEWGATSKTPYPVIFAFDGAGCRFEARALELKKAAAKTRYVVVTPVSFSNANELKIEDYPDYDPELVKKLTPLMARDERIDWDMAGADALYAALRERFRLEEKAYLTGYSGGGFPVHKWIRSRTESVAAACLVSANYGGERADDRRAPEDGGPPIYFITGENDAAKERIFPQTDQALETLRNAGFKDVDHRRLKGRQHETFPDLTIEFFEASRKKASK
jgi:poly(3-hydroxybutyrate) depolymerase